MENNGYLKAGEIALSGDSIKITTVLGSCVSVSMWDARKRVGGICHYKSPHNDGRRRNLNFYGEHAIDGLFHEMLRRGCTRNGLEVRIYGGGEVISHLDELDIGGLNARFAARRLEELGLHVAHVDTGGAYGRRLVFDTADGSVSCERVKSLDEALRDFKSSMTKPRKH